MEIVDGIPSDFQNHEPPVRQKMKYDPQLFLPDLRLTTQLMAAQRYPEALHAAELLRHNIFQSYYDSLINLEAYQFIDNQKEWLPSELAWLFMSDELKWFHQEAERSMALGTSSKL